MSLVSEKPVRFHFLDGLRAVAASMVVILHAFASNIVKLSDKSHLHFLGALFNYVDGYGVDLFFVLSGVVLLRPYLRKQREFKVVEYFRRRFWRIYPPYFVALLFAALVIWFMNRYPTWYNSTGGMNMKFSWREIIHEMPIINFDGNYYNLAWWSLGTEILFYLVVPIVVFLYPSRAKLTDGRLVLAIFFGVVLTALLMVFFSGWISSIYSFTYIVLNIGRFVEYPVCFMMGVLIAAKDFDLKHARVFFISGVFLIFCSSVYPSIFKHLGPSNGLGAWLASQNFPPFFLHSGYGLVFGGVITFAFNNRSFRDVLSKPFMLWLGERSYSLFVVHFSVFYLTDNIISRFLTNRSTFYAVLSRGIGLPAALFVAMLLFHFVERKFARGLVTANMFWPWQTKSLRNIGE
jgi:peptidoglycan/LPS O-acetylase OafA/YrhL